MQHRDVAPTFGRNPANAGRHGYLAPALLVALVAVLMVLALVVDRLWLQNASVEMEAGVESAALAAARKLVSDDLLRAAGYRRNDTLQRCRDSAMTIAADNTVAGSSLQLQNGNILFGHLASAGPTGRMRFVQSDQQPTTVVVTATRTRSGGNPVSLFLQELTGVSGGDVSCRISASVDNHVVGLRPSDSVPVPMWPFAILESNKGQTDSRLQNWQTHIDGRAGQDKYRYDESSQRVVSGADGIPEIVLVCPAASKRSKSNKGNFRLLDVGNGFHRNRISDQLHRGITATDMRASSGEIRLDGQPLEFNAYDNLPDQFRTQMNRLAGQCRMLFLYAENQAPSKDGFSRVHCTRLVAGRVMRIRTLTDGSCELVFQPGTLTTRTVILAGCSLPASERERFRNPYIYKVQLTGSVNRR